MRLQPLRDFGIGIGLGAVIAAAVWLYYPGEWQVSPHAAVDAALVRRATLQAQREAAAPAPLPVGGAPGAAGDWQPFRPVQDEPPPPVVVGPEAAALAEPRFEPPTSVLATADERPVAAEAPVRDLPALVRADPELAQLDADLQRLRAQARSVSSDPDGFRRRADAAQAARAACRDRACLLQWYARRRSALLQEF